MTPSGGYHLNGQAAPDGADGDGAGPETSHQGSGGVTDEDQGEAPPGLRAADDAPGGELGADAGRSRPKKAPNAFRTISEVADELHIPQHVLRFWESKFPQVKPLKRGGGRRYYRPDDILLLRRISDLLYIQGYTIKGVQRLLREGGGRLADDIPPATADERAAAEAERDFGLPAPPPAELTLTIPEPPPLAARRPNEADRLRAALLHTLAELEAIRELLP
jgi:DNA-binding transcriptional MerR regulator